MTTCLRSGLACLRGCTMHRSLRVLLFLCAVVAIVSASLIEAQEAAEDSGNCTIERAECVAAGESCDADFIRDPSFCRESNSSSSSCCQYPLYCVDGTCKEDNTGSNCTKDDDCLIAFYGTGMHKCINNTCQMLLNANDYCSSDSECIDGMICEKGRCKGFAEGHKCTPPYSVAERPSIFGKTHYVCGEGLVCAREEDTGRYFCVYGRNVSQECSKSSPCNYYLACNDGICVKPYSVEVGSRCTDPHACSCLNGTCVQSTEYEYVECKSDKDCGDGTNGTCGACNPLTGKRSCGTLHTVDQCSEEWADALSCYERKRCAPVPGSVMESCVQEQCTTETNNLLSCKTNCAAYRGSMSKCAAYLILRNCPKFPMWARIVTAFTILFAAVGTIFVVYGISLLMTKKKYSRLNSS